MAQSRRKGHNFEREIARTLGLNRNIDQSRDGGTDLHHEDYAIECKIRARSVNVYDAMEQAKNAEVGSKYPRYPIVIHRVDNKETLVTLRLSDAVLLIPRLRGKTDIVDDIMET